jgi:hypothetical protein
MNRMRGMRGGTAEPSERDRRFALLVAMMTDDPHRAIRRRRSRPSFARGNAMNEHERPVVSKANKVRVQTGETGHHVRYILFASLALVIVLFIGVAIFIRL